MLSIVIPTYRRGLVLIETIKLLSPLRTSLSCHTELLVIDQTECHPPSIRDKLRSLEANGELKWLRLSKPHLTRAMNIGLTKAKGDIVLFLDDDIVPSLQLLAAHLSSHDQWPNAWAVVGQILQPNQTPTDSDHETHKSLFWRDSNFPFNSIRPSFIANAMAGNLSLKRIQAITVGGFDENFPPPVASRFESEFAKRLIRSGGMIRFDPHASLDHLASPAGGTRSQGSHLRSASPCFGVGDCYFALRCAHGFDRIWYLLRKPFREVRTRFHLTHPWWIPIKLIGELRALLMALSLVSQPPKYICLRYDEFILSD